MEEDHDGTGWTGLIIAALIFAWVIYLKVKGTPRWARQGLSTGQRATLAKYAIHYQRLGPEEKQRFERIVSTFIHDKEWRGVRMRVEEEMKVMVSACAAELLLGFPELELRHFDTIVLHPDSYRSNSGRMHQGEVRPKAGVIMISWRDFLHGYAHTRDAHNVGLHEMAHALWFENKIQNGEHNFLHPELLQDWIDHADAEMERIKSGKSGLLREYAGTNQPEFFAVAVEYFFELPREFKQDLPELYAVLSAMLRQDPAALDR
jgi:Mlc titration factor MtfA (ptsG expression regulator)